MALRNLPPFTSDADFSHFSALGHASFSDAWAASETTRGSFATVVQAVWKPPSGDHRRVALKLMHESRCSYELFMKEVHVLSTARAQAETADIAGLRNLSLVYCAGIVRDARSVVPVVPPVNGALFFIAMEQLDGRSLRDWLICGPLPSEQALRAAADMMAALSALHALGFAHGDLK